MTSKDWDYRRIGDVLSKVRKPVEVEKDVKYRQIGIRSHGKGLFHKDEVTGKKLGNKSVFWIEPNCLVLNIVFAWEQAIAKTTDKEMGFIGSHRFPQFKPKNDLVDIDYLVYFFKTLRGKHLLGLASPGGAGRNKTLGQKDFANTKLLLPTLPEQQKITRILSTWDGAIETIEKLIEKSQQQKKALMQQLLTGKERLPGFNGEWKEVTLSEIADILVSNVDKKTVPGEDSILLCNYTDVYHNDFITNGISFMRATATKSQIKKYKIQYGDILITKDSESPDDIAVPAFVDEYFENVLCGYHLAIVRPDGNKADGVFLSNLFSLPKIRYYFYTLANGATRFGLGLSSIKNAVFHVPPLSEQQAISKVLRSSSDLILNQLKQLKTLRTQKEALMQQLLTGKRRVQYGQ